MVIMNETGGRRQEVVRKFRRLTAFRHLPAVSYTSRCDALK
jgi:hypothetical protein